MNKNDLKNKINKFVESKNFKIGIYILGAVFILFFVFQAGMIAGYKKASFRHNWGDNYERNFGSEKRGSQFMKDNFGDMPNAHGAIGKIIKIEYPNIFVLDKDQTEKVVIINDNTSILERREKVNKDILTIDKFIIVIGTPNEAGQIEAKLIRIMPSPEEMFNNDIPKDGMMNDLKELDNKNI